MKWRFPNWELWVVFAVALILRLVFVWQWQKLPYGLAPFLDAKSYDDWAVEILNGKFMRETAFYQSPLYSYFLAFVYKIFGHSLVVVSGIQALLGALTCWLIALMTKRHFDDRAALEAGLLAAMGSAMIFYSAPVLKETLMLFCLTLFLFFAMDAFVGKFRSAIWSGFALGAAILLRGNLLLILPVYLALLIWRLRSQSWRLVIVATFAALFLIAPVTWHNWKATGGDFVLTTYGGGFNFYTGNWPQATGANFYPATVSTDPIQEEADTRRIAEEALKRPLRPSEVSDYWFEEGKKSAFENPLHWLRLAAHKVWYFWNDHEIADNYDSEFVGREGHSILSWPLVTFGFMVPFAIFGFAVALRLSFQMQALLAFTLTYMFSAMLFYVTDRYRLPVVIFLLPAAGVGTALLTEMVRRRMWGPILKAAVPVIPFLALGFFPLPAGVLISDAYNWGLQATLYSDAGRDNEAVQAIEKALKINPALVQPQSYVTASTSYERLGNLPRAEALLVQATEMYPNDGFTYYNLARFHYEHGRSDSAIDLYNKALFIMPYHFQPYIGLGVLYFARKEYGLARESVRRGLLLNSESPQLLQLQKMLEDLPGSK